MSQQLTLILQTPVEDLVPKMLAWNNKELLASVKESLERYKGITYDDSQITLAKTDRAKLNAFSKALNDERIRIGKIYNAPYEKFKSEVDEVIAQVKEAAGQIDEQVKTFENAKQESKREKIIAYYNSVIGDLVDCLPYEKIEQKKWLNASVSMTAVESEVDAAIANARQAMTAIEALYSVDEALIKSFYFRTLNLADALTENERLKQERAKVADLSMASNNESHDGSLQVVKFQVEASVEQLKLLQRFLLDNGIKYSQIKEIK